MNLLGNKTQRIHPLYVPVANKLSYWRYTIRRHRNYKSIFALLLFLCSVFFAALDLLDFVGGGLLYRVMYIVMLILSLLLRLFDTAKNFEDRYTTVREIPGFFDDVQPPVTNNGKWHWDRIDLHMCSGAVEPVFRCEELDLWLRDDRQPIGIQRKLSSERTLNRMIGNDENWQELYALFLRHNHREAMYSGKQFYNEAKYGIASELCPGKPVSIHKTCYFDSYLTHIIPGRILLRNRDNAVLAELSVQNYPHHIPYTEDTSHKRTLKPVGSYVMANEPGVTTLCITKDGFIYLWRQNRSAQSSAGLLAASGSGSVDWEDCKDFFQDEDGLRKAVIRGMNRELWEESVGKRDVSGRVFCQHLDTRITGYFRWLKKAGKSEFVGISRLRDEYNEFSNALKPEVSEVISGEQLPAGTMYTLKTELRQQLAGQVPPLQDPAAAAEPREYSVSCAMAMLSLHEVCETYCHSSCPHNGACRNDQCPFHPYEVLFPEAT